MARNNRALKKSRSPKTTRTERGFAPQYEKPSDILPFAGSVRKEFGLLFGYLIMRLALKDPAPDPKSGSSKILKVTVSISAATIATLIALLAKRRGYF